MFSLSSSVSEGNVHSSVHTLSHTADVASQGMNEGGRTEEEKQRHSSLFPSGY